MRSCSWLVLVSEINISRRENLAPAHNADFTACGTPGLSANLWRPDSDGKYILDRGTGWLVPCALAPLCTLCSMAASLLAGLAGGWGDPEAPWLPLADPLWSTSSVPVCIAGPEDLPDMATFSLGFPGGNEAGPDASKAAMRVVDVDRLGLLGGLNVPLSPLDLDPLEPKPIMPLLADAALAMKL